MKFEKPKNSNYCGIVVRLSQFVELPGCDNVKAAIVFNNSVIVSKSAQPGDVGVYFPVETQLMRDFLAHNNLYCKPEWGNADPEKKGFFEEHGRVKAVKFRGHKSEGFWMPLSCLSYLGIPLDEFPVGAEFDAVADRVICKKYVPRFQSRVGSGPNTAKSALKQREAKIVEGQFRFHPDTENLRRNAHKITPAMWLSISDKWHGTSGVWSNILVNRKLSWLERLAKRLGVKVQEQEYGFTWSSRRVIKGVNEPFDGKEHYYSEDIWGVVAGEIRDRVPKGITIYGEVVGYTTDGKPIQKGYHYGCQPGQHRLLVYRVTTTNADGKVIEFGWQQMKAFCAKYGFEPVKELWYGRANDLVSVYDIEDLTLDKWQSQFLAKVESLWVHDQMCPHNEMSVPAEGVVVKVDTLEDPLALKCKNFAFLNWEGKQLDSGEVDIETRESEDLAA